MSKRNLILITIILTVIVAGAFVFFYLYQPKDQTVDDTEDTNFFANFLPFGKSKTTTPSDTTTPADISGFEPAPEEEIQNVNLKKVSDFPVAGFGVFMKERYKEIPNPSQTLPLSGEENPIPPTKEDSGGLTEFVPMLRYVDKATGNIYQTFADKIDERKFSSSIIPRVYEAFFGNKGESNT